MLIQTDYNPDKYAYVEFDRDSTIDFIDTKTEDLILRLQPSELKAIYAAFFLMEKENAELDSIKYRK